MEYRQPLTWMARRNPNYFLKKSASGQYEERRVSWDHCTQRVLDSGTGEVIHDMQCGFHQLNRMISKMLVASLAQVVREQVNC